MFASRTALRPSDVVVRAAIVALTLATGYIHSTLGGLLFTLNALGYAVAAVAMMIPLALAVRFRWVVRARPHRLCRHGHHRLGRQGPYFSTAYIAKAIEVALIVAVAVDFVRHDGNPVRSCAASSPSSPRSSAPAAPPARAPSRSNRPNFEGVR